MPETESVVDQMADDATAAPEYPDGAPELVPIIHVRPRARRGEVKRKFKDFQGVQEKLDRARAQGLFDDLDEDADEKPADPTLHAARIEAAADVDDMLQLMDDIMRMCASDPGEYELWSATADDEVLTKTFAAFSARSQPGEASGSTS